MLFCASGVDVMLEIAEEFGPAALVVVARGLIDELRVMEGEQGAAAVGPDRHRHLGDALRRRMPGPAEHQPLVRHHLAIDAADLVIFTVGPGELDPVAAADAASAAAIARPELIGEIADRFGAQVLVLSLDVKRAPTTHSGFVVTTHGGRTQTTLDALEWAREAAERGAGELLVNSIDADGTRDGFDLELVSLMREIASVPVIASGGAGKAEDFAPAIKAGADAVLAASVFHTGALTVGDVKDALRSEGVIVR